MNKKGKIFIGTSGWTYDHWQGIFYPDDLVKTKWLDYYCQHFDTVELNASFYYLPKPQTFVSWRKKTPDNFLFSVKASRYITHIKKLRNIKEPWKRFITSAKELKEKLGPILFQLPPSLKVNPKVLEDFLKILPKKRYCYTIEPRNQTWFCEKVYKTLKKYNIALCIASTPNYPTTEIVTANFVYLRLHGSKDLYASKYTEKELKNWARKIKKWQSQNLDIYVYFDNDAYGYAVENAKRLKELI